MATEVEITTAIDTAQAQQGLSNLRKGLKDLISLQEQVGRDSKNFGKLQQAITQTEGKIGDLTDSFQTLRGSGIERINSSLGLFREGLLNADTDKIKTGLQGIGSAMKAIPIFAMVEGARLLIENFDKINAAVSELVNGFTEEAIAAKALNEEYEKQSELNSKLLVDLDNEIKLLKAKKAPLEEILAAEQKSFDLKIKTLTLQLAKEKANLREEASNKSLFDSFLALNGVMSGNIALIEKSNETQIKNVTETAKKISDITTQLKNTETEKEVNKINTLNQLRDEEAKAREERIKHVQELIAQNDRNEEEREKLRLSLEQEQHDKELEEAIRFIEEEKRIAQEEKDFMSALNDGAAIQEAAKSDAINADNLKRFRNNAALEKSELVLTTADKIAAVQLLRDQELAQEQLTVDQRVAIIKKAESDILSIRTESALQTIAITQQYAEVLSGLNDIHNQDQVKELKRLEKVKQQSIASGTKTQVQAEAEYLKASLKIKKEQFEREKKLKIANIAIDTASALVKTTAQLGGVGAITPAGALMLAGIAALGITEAAVVANQDFDDSGFTTPSIPEISSGGSAPSSDRTPERSPIPFNPQARVNGQQNNTLKVVVLQSDIKETMQQVEVLEDRATFGV